MKKLSLSMIFLLIAGIMQLNAQKQYAVGDIMEMDGMRCVVIAVDENGTSGKIMSPYATIDEKRIKYTTDYIEREVKKLIKKKKISPDDKDAEIQKALRTLIATFKPIKSEKIKKDQYRHLTEEFSNTLPEGWHLPTFTDVNYICQLLGFKGLEAQESAYNIEKNIEKNIEDKWAQEQLLSIDEHSFFCGDLSKLSFAKFNAKTAWIGFFPIGKSGQRHYTIEDASVNDTRDVVTLVVKEFGYSIPENFSNSKP